MKWRNVLWRRRRAGDLYQGASYQRTGHFPERYPEPAAAEVPAGLPRMRGARSTARGHGYRSTDGDFDPLLYV